MHRTVVTNPKYNNTRFVRTTTACTHYTNAVQGHRQRKGNKNETTPNAQRRTQTKPKIQSTMLMRASQYIQTAIYSDDSVSSSVFFYVFIDFVLPASLSSADKFLFS